MTNKFKLRTLLVLLLAATCTAAFAAKSKQSAPPLPKDPEALLALAAQHNGLTGPNLNPWHIKATYQLYDAKGNPTQKGTFEEWWANPHLYKFSFHRANYHLQIVANSKGTYVSGNDTIPDPEYLVRRLFLHPVATKLPAKGMKLHYNMEKLGKARLACVEEIPEGLGPTGFHQLNPTFPTYCLEPFAPVLLLFGSYGQSFTQITGVGMLEGRNLPIHATLLDAGIKYLTVHLTQGESAARWPPSTFIPPPGADLKPARNTLPVISQKVIAGRKLSGDDPGYPPSAKALHQEGKVTLAAVINKNGRIRSLIVTSAPAMSLANSALAAVKTWKYKPYLQNGHSVNVRTQITVIYSL